MESPELDTNAEEFLTEIVQEMVSRFGIFQDEAIARINYAWKNKRIVGDHIIYHETPEYWAQALYFGKRDFWKYSKNELVPIKFPPSS